MKYQIKNNESGEVIFEGCAMEIAEALSLLIEERYGFRPLLQEHETKKGTEMFLHSDSYQFLTEKEIELLEKKGIVEDHCLLAICTLLNISVVRREVRAG